MPNAFNTTLLSCLHSHWFAHPHMRRLPSVDKVEDMIQTCRKKKWKIHVIYDEHGDQMHSSQCPIYRSRSVFLSLKSLTKMYYLQQVLLKKNYPGWIIRKPAKTSNPHHKPRIWSGCNEKQLIFCPLWEDCFLPREEGEQWPVFGYGRDLD